MKKFFVLLAVMLMSSTKSFAQTELELLKQKAELDKAYGFKDKASSEAKKQAKEMKKEGWRVNAGDRSLEMQIQSGIDLKKRIMKSADGRIVEKFFILSGRQHNHLIMLIQVHVLKLRQKLHQLSRLRFPRLSRESKIISNSQASML